MFERIGPELSELVKALRTFEREFEKLYKKRGLSEEDSNRMHDARFYTDKARQKIIDLCSKDKSIRVFKIMKMDEGEAALVVQSIEEGMQIAGGETGAKFVVEIDELTQAELDNLPEFDGF